MNKLRVYKIHKNAYMPTVGTEWSACFDLRASLRIDDIVKVYGVGESDYTDFRIVFDHPTQGPSIFLGSGERALIPTGLIFDIDEGWSIRVHPRSSVSIKRGLALPNCEGVIDADYVEQTYITLMNIAKTNEIISDGERLVQAEMVPVYPVEFEEIASAPAQKTDRIGGLGSTGEL